MQIIPAIDIIGGKCVRLTKGNYSEVTQYADDPLAVARSFEEAGIKRLHLVDLDGARARHVVNIDVLRKICTHTDLHVDFGGGVKTRDDLDRVFDAGARQVTAGSIAASDPGQVKDWLQEYGSDRIILGADVLDRKIMVSGWQESAGLELFDFLDDYTRAGAEYVICTDISKDGVLAGPAFEVYKEIVEKFPNIKLIASGGVSGVPDLEKLAKEKLFGAIVGKAFYEGRVSLQELKAIQDVD